MTSYIPSNVAKKDNFIILKEWSSDVEYTEPWKIIETFED